MSSTTRKPAVKPAKPAAPVEVEPIVTTPIEDAPIIDAPEDVEDNVLSSNVYHIARVVERTVTYQVADEENGGFKEESFKTTDVTVKEDGLHQITPTGEDVEVKRISFNPSYFTANLMAVNQAMELFVKCQKKLIDMDEFYKELSIEIKQTVHNVNDAIPGTNRTYASSGISNEIVRFIPSALAKAELKRVVYITAHMSAKAEAQAKVVRALLAKRAESVISALDALDALDDEDDVDVLIASQVDDVPDEAEVTDVADAPQA